MPTKAEKLLATPGAIKRDPDHPQDFIVRGSAAAYRVQVLDLDDTVALTCTCPHGQVHGAASHCYHVEAVRLHLEGTPLVQE